MTDICKNNDFILEDILHNFEGDDMDYIYIQEEILKLLRLPNFPTIITPQHPGIHLVEYLN